MSFSIETVTLHGLSLALDAAALRQQVIATNIANANVDGYVAQGVSFDAAMTDASGALDATGAATSGPRAHVGPKLDSEGRPQPVQIDAEMADLSLNQLRYQSLISGLNKHLSVLAVAIADGKS